MGIQDEANITVVRTDKPEIDGSKPRGNKSEGTTTVGMVVDALPYISANLGLFSTIIRNPKPGTTGT